MGEVISILISVTAFPRDAGRPNLAPNLSSFFSSQLESLHLDFWKHYRSSETRTLHIRSSSGVKVLK